MSTLHLADGDTATTAAQCARVAPGGSDLLVVAFEGSPARWLDGWRTAVGDPDRATFVVADAAEWLAGAPRARIDSAAAPDTTVSTSLVDSPGNLTDLGVTLLDALESHDAADARTTFCCQSLTVLLQYSTTDEMYQFLHVLIRHLERFDAVGHFHLHERAHDAETVATLRRPFDRVRSDGEAGDD
ncbi:DUF7504 family protein [Haloplanus rubicundus]|uniref:Uncharacterized protein n=1 Tax=Haloplanus rubicundus TaxID=1547898 RepID=A0A345EBE0_9EURY|nr:hypothetical protein [Haloplanus rubicundus]AXG09512.1 hypothetical protein DU484_06310 [Haloplanus rubicundus]